MEYGPCAAGGGDKRPYRKIGKKPKAIVPVALYGMPYDCKRIMEIADRYDIPVVEDAAEGFGSKFDGRILGTFGKFGVLSFNGNKMITTSGGGALVCQSVEDKNTVMWYATQRVMLILTISIRPLATTIV